MKWASVLSTEENLEAALAEASRGVTNAVGQQPTVVFLFISPFYQLHFDCLPELFSRYFPETTVIGCSARGIFAGGVELEDTLGVGIIGAYLPDVDVLPFHLDSPGIDPAELIGQADASPHMVLFSDPESFDHFDFVARLNKSSCPPKVIGGLASGASESTYNVLFLNDRVYKSGAVGLILSGNIALEQVVSQGSKAIGAPCFATRVRGNVLYELDGVAADLVIADMLERADPHEKLLFEECPLLGVSEEDTLHEDDRTPYEIRHVVGIDEAANAIILDEPISEHCIVRFHVGDPYFSHEYLMENLKRCQEEYSEGELSGALIFSCARRGEAFYQEQGHETTVFKECFSSVPLGGFFSYGELVQHQGKARICGLSSAFAFFRPRRTR